MKKIIRGRLYDTETATLIGEKTSGLPRNDLDYWEEELYRKRTGEYFVFGWGNARSKYGVWKNNHGMSGEKILPLSYEEAAAWAEEVLSPEEYSGLFEIERDDTTERLTISLSKENISKLRQYAAIHDKTISRVISEWINTL